MQISLHQASETLIRFALILKNLEADNKHSIYYKTPICIVCYTAFFSVVTQRSSPLVSGEERCVTTLKTAV